MRISTTIEFDLPEELLNGKTKDEDIRILVYEELLRAAVLYHRESATMLNTDMLPLAVSEQAVATHTAWGDALYNASMKVKYDQSRIS